MPTRMLILMEAQLTQMPMHTPTIRMAAEVGFTPVTNLDKGAAWAKALALAISISEGSR